MPTLAIDFGGTEIKIGLAADASASTRQGSKPTLLATTSIPATTSSADLEAVANAVRSLQDRALASVDAVGIAVPGVVDRRGRLLHAHEKYDDFRDLDIAAWGAEAFAADSVVIENDARAALVGGLASLQTASSTTPDDAVLMTLGTGIGTAALVDGNLVRGAHGHAGILGGHVTVEITAERCPCGNIGCAEWLAGSDALARRDSSAASLRGLFASNDEIDAAVADDFIRVWGAAAVTLCHMFDPDVLLLAGGVLRAGDRVRKPIERYVHEHLWPTAFRPPVLVPPQPELSVLYGLVILAERGADTDTAMTIAKTGAQ